jgi:putative FmdB family regulatory protein
MPIYDYKCANGHEFEVFQNMSEDPVSECPECGASVERVFHPVAVHFKGSGFYTTDYARSGNKSSSSTESKNDSDSDSDSGDSKKSDSSKSDSSSKDSGGEKASTTKTSSSGD